MEANPNISVEIPTALPGFEDDDAREKLLLETAEEGRDGEAEDQEIDLENEIAKPKKHRWQVLRTFAGFAAFICILAVAISWFFGMGWFAEKKPQPVSRGGQKDAQTAPVTEDEKLKMALSMVAAPAPVTPGNPEGLPVSVESPEDTGARDLKTDLADVSPVAGVDTDKKISTNDRQSYSLPSTVEDFTDKSAPSVAVRNETSSTAKQKAADSDNAPERSLFFGISRKAVQENETPKLTETEVSRTSLPEPSRPSQIPFGTLLPVRLVGSIYTLRNSAGFVRMELTRPIEGKGYSYPAGTMIVGNVRGGESARAFVTIAGLIDPVSGELVRFSGELLGRDGGSGIEGRRRNLTSQWSRFFRGLKDTAASVLGSVGARRSGSTVILSEPIRRGTESMSEDLSGALLKNGREDTFLEVAAGSNGYVLVTGLPENSAAVVNRPDPEAGNE